MSTLSVRSARSSCARRSLTLSSLLWLSACSGSELELGERPEPEVQSSDLHGSSLPEPEYTPEQLQALAEDPATEALKEPFSPAPDADESRYVTVPDGTRLALSFYFPEGFDRSASKAPIAYVEAWYGRAVEARGTAIDLYRAAGFIVVIGDPRGFGSSFGSQPGLMDDAMRRNGQDIVRWLAAQPWSNGKVVAMGWSASCNSVDALAGSDVESLVGGIARAPDFDHYDHNLFPGGVPNSGILGLVDFLLGWMRGVPCPDDRSGCFPPVDEDVDGTLLAAAFAEHQGNLSSEALATIAYKDDALGAGSFPMMSGAGHIDELRARNLPVRLAASWLDGTTADSVLARFEALPDAPMEIVIGATTHSGAADADPFSRRPFQPAPRSAIAQHEADLDFLARLLAGQAGERRIDYYVLGSGEWKSTAVWPPEGVTRHTLQLSRSKLVPHTRGPAGERQYTVDAATSTAPFNRWASQTGGFVYYGDRRFAPGERVVFDAAPVAHDVELVGAPELCLALRSDQTDGVVIAYLEDVAPDGRVTYLTEGELRLLQRKTASGACDPAPGTTRSFTRADAAPVVPGELMRIEIPLWPTAARIAAGHHLRLSLAGADAGTFPLVSDAPATWSIAYGEGSGSSLTLPLKPWS
jgi:putative CocE/NonD family hydrolase